MEVRNIKQQEPFITKDGSQIRSILDLSNASVRKQSLAEAVVPAGGSTDRHYHKESEELYFLLEGEAVMEVSGVEKDVGPGDAIVIPAGEWHQITGKTEVRFLCCCAPPYAHEDTYFG